MGPDNEKEEALKPAEFQTDEYEAEPRKLQPRIDFIIGLLAIALSFFQIYTSWRGSFEIFVQRPIHIAFAFTILFAIYPPLKKGRRKHEVLWIDWLLIALNLACTLWVLVNAERFFESPEEPILIDLVLGGIMILLVLEGTRRILGPALPVIAILTLTYALLGPYFPGSWAHGGFRIRMVLERLYASTLGIWGLLTGISASVIPGFLIFGAMLEKTGGGDIFMDLAKRIAGRSHGGAGKVSCFSSAFFGTISGSAVANVVVTGTFTIPLMKSLKYKPELAGAIEATTSSGGQIMPPVMGAGAFIMAEILKIPYSRVALAGAIPALLYYLGCYSAIHFEAKRLQLKPLPPEMIPSFRKKILPKSLPFFLPVSILVYLLAVGYSPTKSVAYSIFFSAGWHLVTSRDRETLKIRIKQIIGGLEAGGKATVMVAALCVCAQIVVAMFGLTGFGVKLSQSIIDLSGGSMFLTLFFGMIITLILGMGVPTAAAYVLAASVVGPSIITLGAHPLSAHFFIFYFAIISAITPPVCAAVYVGAAMAKANWWKTGWIACRLGLAGFIIPYMFFYAPTLLFFGDPLHIAVNSFTAALGVVILAAAVMGFLRTPLHWIERILLLLSGLMLIDPSFVTDTIGVAIAVMVYVNQKFSLISTRLHRGELGET
jgi:TRAP transporter 4TM/12TM fusion protein